MLEQLHIQNYAIIEVLEIRFSGALNVITGETGAGKSILMGALGLVLGDRADTSVLLDKEKKCVIEAVFKTDYRAVRDLLKDNELDWEPEMLLRREISASGKSRAFINDTPVTLSQLRQLSELLVDLHQQFDTLDLNSNDFQREVIDALAGNGKHLASYQEVYKKYQEVLHQLQQLKEEQATANKELDYNQFLFDELNQANFRDNEIEDTEAEIRFMSNAENIKVTLAEIYFAMEESDQPLVQQLKSLNQKLQSLTRNFPEIESLAGRLTSVQIELKDIASEIDRLSTRVQFDEERISLLNERMTAAYGLLKKHNANTTAELLTIRERLESELLKVVNLSDEIEKKEQLADEYNRRAMELAELITAKRNGQLKPFEDKVNRLLVQVGMPNARVKVMVRTEGALHLFGNSTVEFLFNANLSAAQRQFEPIRKVASGGELGRLMLSIKSLVASHVHLPTLIFDEIDSGISGEAARQVGIIIRDLSSAHQVVAITHQPQIAAKADTHFYVYKEQKDGQIVTSIKILDPGERINAIATMLSGKKPTAAAFENAREMIGA